MNFISIDLIWHRQLLSFFKTMILPVHTIPGADTGFSEGGGGGGEGQGGPLRGGGGDRPCRRKITI